MIRIVIHYLNGHTGIVSRLNALRDEGGAVSMVSLANYVAEHIKDEFPDVAVDTLAYQYTRKAPKTVDGGQTGSISATENSAGQVASRPRFTPSK